MTEIEVSSLRQTNAERTDEQIEALESQTAVGRLQEHFRHGTGTPTAVRATTSTVSFTPHSVPSNKTGQVCSGRSADPSGHTWMMPWREQAAR